MDTTNTTGVTTNHSLDQLTGGRNNLSGGSGSAGGAGGPEDGFEHWHVYLESVFIGVICIAGILGNVIVIRNASNSLKYSKQNSIIALSLSTSDFFICLVRGPSLIYVLFHLSRSNGSVVCDLWMFSTIFVMITVMTNMIVAIERYMIVHSFQKYVKLFTPRHVVLLLGTLWFTLASIFTSIYLGLGYDAAVRTDTRSCTLTSTLPVMAGWSSFALCLVAVVIFGLAPLLVLAFCYVSIVHNICKAGLLKLDKLEEKVNYSRVTYVSCARALLMVACWTPFLICAVVASAYPDTLGSSLQYVDYILIIQSAMCPYLTMQDNDFKEAFSRRKSRYLPVFLSAKREVKPIGQSNISSADLKTM